MSLQCFSGFEPYKPFRIKRKLCELGWEKEFNQMTALDEYSFRRHALVTRIKPLTDRGMWVSEIALKVS